MDENDVKKFFTSKVCCEQKMHYTEGDLTPNGENYMVYCKKCGTFYHVEIGGLDEEELEGLE